MGKGTGLVHRQCTCWEIRSSRNGRRVIEFHSDNLIRLKHGEVERLTSSNASNADIEACVNCHIISKNDRITGFREIHLVDNHLGVGGGNGSKSKKEYEFFHDRVVG